MPKLLSGALATLDEQGKGELLGAMNMPSEDGTAGLDLSMEDLEWLLKRSYRDRGNRNLKFLRAIPGVADTLDPFSYRRTAALLSAFGSLIVPAATPHK